MSQESASQKTKVCPTCGTRLSDTAVRCPVCGTDLGTGSKPSTPETPKKADKALQASRMPEITLSLPAAIGFLALFLIAGAVVVYFSLRGIGAVQDPTPVPTVTETPTSTLVPTETLIPTDIPTATPLPPLDYTVVSGDTCLSIADTFNVSFQSIIIENNLAANCSNLVVGQVLKVPYPTPTIAPPATNTPESLTATAIACDKINVTVQENDTLSSIAANYQVPMEAIKEFNGLSTDNVFLGQSLIIPLCRRAATPGPTPTATIPPPYPAPNLLLPGDGAAFTLANDVVTLQWASIGTLRENEAYQVTVEDVTEGQGRRTTEYVTDTKFIVPTNFRPKDNLAHIMRWWVVSVRQTGTDEQGEPIYDTAGATSEKRTFSWMGSAPEATETP